MEKYLLDRVKHIEGIYDDFLSMDIKNSVETFIWQDFAKHIEDFKIKKKDIYNRVENIENGQIVLSIGIFGTFSTGKSSIINSILNEKILLEDVNPSTALVSIMKYGDKKKILLCYENGERKEITEEEFKITANHQQGDHEAEGKDRKRIDHVEIYYPCEVLRNINLVDTPGFKSALEDDDELTIKWLDYVDIFLWTFDINKGTIHKDEMDLLSNVSSKIGSKRILAILNKVDRKPHSERLKLMSEFQKEFNFHMLIPYSAKNVLKNVVGSRESKELIDQLAAEMIKSNDSEEKKIIAISSSKVQIIENGKVEREEKLNKLNNDEYLESYVKLKEYLLSLHSEKKNLREEELNRIIKETYLKEITNLNILMDKLNENIQNLNTEREEALNVIYNFGRNFFTDFNLKFEIEKTILYSRMEMKFRNAKDDDEVYNILKSAFKKIYEESLSAFNNYLRKEFNYSSEEKLEELEFFINEFLDAAHNSIKGIWYIYKSKHQYLNKETLDLLVPDEQYKKVLDKFYINNIESLRKKVAHELNQKLEKLKGFLVKMDRLLVMEPKQFQVHNKVTAELYQKEAAATIERNEAITKLVVSLRKKTN